MEKDEYMRIYPNPTSGVIHIETQKAADFHIIEKMMLTDDTGKVIRQYGTAPTKFFIDISDLKDGNYRLVVKTNKAEKTFKVVLNKNR